DALVRAAFHPKRVQSCVPVAPPPVGGVVVLVSLCAPSGELLSHDATAHTAPTRIDATRMNPRMLGSRCQMVHADTRAEVLSSACITRESRAQHQVRRASPQAQA